MSIFLIFQLTSRSAINKEETINNWTALLTAYCLLFYLPLHLNSPGSLFFKPPYADSSDLKFLMPAAIFIIAVMIDGFLHFY